MEIEQNIWGFTAEGEAIVLYKMTNAGGASVKLTNIGATVVSVEVPDRDGRLANVALGYDDFKSYFGDGPCMGKTVGRFAQPDPGSEIYVGRRGIPIVGELLRRAAPYARRRHQRLCEQNLGEPRGDRPGRFLAVQSRRRPGVSGRT